MSANAAPMNKCTVGFDFLGSRYFVRNVHFNLLENPGCLFGVKRGVSIHLIENMTLHREKGLIGN